MTDAVLNNFVVDQAERLPPSVCLPAVFTDSFTLWESMEMMMSFCCDENVSKL